MIIIPRLYLIFDPKLARSIPYESQERATLTALYVQFQPTEHSDCLWEANIEGITLNWVNYDYVITSPSKPSRAQMLDTVEWLQRRREVVPLYGAYPYRQGEFVSTKTILAPKPISLYI